MRFFISARLGDQHESMWVDPGSNYIHEGWNTWFHYSMALNAMGIAHVPACISNECHHPQDNTIVVMFVVSGVDVYISIIPTTDQEALEIFVLNSMSTSIPYMLIGGSICVRQSMARNIGGMRSRTPVRKMPLVVMLK